MLRLPSLRIWKHVFHQFFLVDFAHNVFRDFRHDFQLSRYPVVRHLFSSPVVQIVQSEFFIRSDNGSDFFSIHGISETNHSDVFNGGMLQEDAFDLQSTDFVAAVFNDIDRRSAENFI